MGGIRKSRKKYENPRKRWDKSRIEDEKELKKLYGLKNKKELRIIQTFVRKKRQNAKNLLVALPEIRAKREKELVKSLTNLGLLPIDATIDDVLSLNTKEALEKRLQTLVWRQNLAKTITQARQFIVHGHISIGGEKMTSPNYLVPQDKVDKIGYYKGKKMVVMEEKAESKEDLKKKFDEAQGSGAETHESEEAPQGDVIENAE